MPRITKRRIVIVGGGASGTILACHLLRDPASDLHVTLIEKRREVGHGVAYSTRNPSHLLNVRAANASAFADDPDHFCRWLAADSTRGDLPCPDTFDFVARTLYGRYVANLIEPLRAANGGSGRLELVTGECVRISYSNCAVFLTLSDGSGLVGDIAVLATGHATPAASHPGSSTDPWLPPFEAGISKHDPVLILGTGLTMIDYVLSLADAGHEGSIRAISRRGLVPRAHRHINPPPIDTSDSEIPFGAELSELLRWLRDLADRSEQDGGDWRSVVDGIRPFTQKLWQRLSLASRRRFLAHARVWWEVHRHRMAPEVDARIRALMATGQLHIIAGNICTVIPQGTHTRIDFRRRGASATESMRVARIVECKGIVTSPLNTSNPAMRSLLDQRLARADPLHIGIDITDTCAIIDHSGRPSDRLFAVGPLTRAAFWEVVAIPEIRAQCAELALRLLNRLGTTDRRRSRARYAAEAAREKSLFSVEKD
jgi:uncharacterized NAD(P)/FAD-binding protein YdhS